MGIFNQSIPKLTYDAINQYRVTPVQEYYVDDIFDPIFNRNVRNALRQQYGNPILGTLGGYADLLENTFTKNNERYGVLSPAMGILSTFGRSMDKADDIILGGLTEGVKGLTGQGFENPLKNIFVEDQDYSGKRLLASMANSMSQFAGGAKLDESDFNALPWTVVGTGIDLATDPSILGSNLIKLSEPNAANAIINNLATAETPVGKVGKFLRDYDDVMANVASNATAPGLRQALSALRGKLFNIIPTTSANPYEDVIIENLDIIEHHRNYPTATVKKAQETLKTNPIVQNLIQMSDAIDNANEVVEKATAEPVSSPPRYRYETETVVSDKYPMNISDKAVKALVTRLKWAINSDMEIADKIDEQYYKPVHDKQRKKLQNAINARTGAVFESLDRANTYLETKGLTLPKSVTSTVNTDDYTESVKDVFENRLELLDGDDERTQLFDSFEDAAEHIPELRNLELNEEYVNSIDWSADAFLKGEFSVNEATNKQIINALTDHHYRKTGHAPESKIAIVSSEIGKLNDRVLFQANRYATQALSKPFVNARARGIVTIKNKDDFDAVTQDLFERVVKTENVSDKGRNFAVNRMRFLLSRILYPPKTFKKYKDSTKRAAYDQLQQYSDIKEFNNLWNEWTSPIYQTDAFGYTLHPETKEQAINEPWTVVGEPITYLQNMSKLGFDDADTATLKMIRKRRNYHDAFDRAFLYYTTGRYAMEGAEPVVSDYTYAKSSNRIPRPTNKQLWDLFGISFDSGELSYFQKAVNAYRKKLNDVKYQTLTSLYPTEQSIAIDLQNAMEDLEDNYFSPTKLELGIGTGRSSESEISLDEHLTYKKSSQGSTELSETRGDRIQNIDLRVPGSRSSLAYLEKNPFTTSLWDLRQRLMNPEATDDPQIVIDLNKRLEGSGYTAEYRGVVNKEFLKKYEHIPEIAATKQVLLDFQKILKETKSALEDPKLHGNWFLANSNPEKYPMLTTYLNTSNPYSNIIREMLQKRSTIEQVEYNGKLYNNVTAFDSEPLITDGNDILNSLMRPKKLETRPATNAFTPDATFEKALGLTEPISFDNTRKVSMENDIQLRTRISKKRIPIVEPLAKENVITVANTDMAAKLAFDAPSSGRAVVDEVVAENCPDVAKLQSDGYSEEYIEHTVEPKQWQLYKQIASAESVQRNESAEPYSLQTNAAKRVIQHAEDVGATTEEVKRMFQIITETRGDVLSSADFATEMRRNKLIVTPVTSRAEYDTLKTVFEHNIAVYNAAAGSDVLKLYQRRVPDKNVVLLGAVLNTSNPNAAVAVIKNANKIEKAPYKDLVFVAPRAITPEESAFVTSRQGKNILNVLRETDGLVKEQSRILGFEFDDKLHTKHVMNIDPNTAEYVANGIYGDSIDEDAFEDFEDVIANSNAFHSKDVGALGVHLKDRRFRGRYWLLDTDRYPLFTYDLTKYVKGSLGEGMMANSKYQTFCGLFLSDEFKLKSINPDVTEDDIVDILYASQGNLDNLDLVAPMYDDNGRLLKFKRFDKYSREGIRKALENPDTVLIPSGTWDSIDKTLRKDLKMSNKAYNFFNKHFTLPFKFGVLTNPGFAVGNINDAVTKQVTTMSQKYGTSIAEETKRFTKSCDDYLRLGNAYNKTMDKWYAIAKENNIELKPTELIPELVAANASSRKRLLQYIHGELIDKNGNKLVCELTPQERSTILMWSDLQTITHGTVSIRDFDEILDSQKTSKFKQPVNIIDRILQGTGKYNAKDPRTWGIATNNPASRLSIRSAELIEDTVRGTNILNDLYHNGYTFDELRKMYLSGATEKIPFQVDRQEATNTMYNANFNYDQQSDFTDAVGNVVPFPTFFLKNFSYWMNLYMTNPKYFAIALRLHNSLWSGRDTSKDEFAAEAKGRGAIPVGDPKLNTFFKGIYKPTPLQSMFGAFSLLNNPAEDMAYRLHPAIQTGLATVGQIKPNSDLTTYLGNKYRPYSTNPYEKNIKQGDREFSPLAFGLHRFNPFERTVNTYLRTPAKIRNRTAQLSDFLPSIFQPDFSKK